jgi:hypothetical protein
MSLRTLVAAMIGVVLGGAPLAGVCAPGPVHPGTPAVTVAVGVQRAQEIALPADFGPNPGARALAQGVREACIQAGLRTARTITATCAELGDAPGSGICVDETAARALSREIVCDGSDASAEAVDLSAAGCETVECFRAEAGRLGANYLLLVSGSWRDGLSVAGNLISLSDGSTVAVGPREGYNAVRPRTGPQVLGIMKWVARDAIARLLLAAVPAPSLPAPVTTTAIDLTPPPVPAGAGSNLAPLGWTLVGAGAVAAAASVWLFVVDRSDVDCSMIVGDPQPCERERRTIVPAIGLAIGSGVALLTGTLLLVRDSREARTQLAVSVHSTGLVLGGRF